MGKSRFQDKVAVITGAEHPLGASLSRRLAALGAMVVAIGREEDRLLALAREAPGRIEPLALRSGRRDALDLLRKAWGDEPLHIYIDVLALCGVGRSATPQDRFARSAGVAAALMRGMREAHAVAVLAVPRSGQEEGPQGRARMAGYTVLVQRLAAEARPARFLGLGLPGAGFVWTEEACRSAGDAALLLCHPVSRGLAAGRVIEWEPEGLPRRNMAVQTAV